MSDNIQHLAHSRSAVKRIFQLYIEYKWALAITLTGSVLFSLVDAGMIYFIKPLIDDGLNNSNSNVLRIGSLIVIGIFIIRGLANFVSNYTANWISHHIVMTLRMKVFSKLLKLPRSFYDQISRGELVAKLIYDSEQVANATSGALISLVRESIILIVLIVLMFITSWRLSLVFLAIGPAIGYILYKVSSSFRQKSKKLQGTMGAISKNVEQAIKNHQEIISFSAQKIEENNFQRVNKSTRQNNMKLVLLSSISNPVIQIIASFAMAAVLLIASIEGMVETITPGEFTAILVAMGSLLKPIKSLSKVNENLQSGFAAAESIYSLLDQPEELDNGIQQNIKPLGTIRLENLSFGYQTNQQPVLENISLAISRGEVIAFVGKSGSGKSTIMDILLRLYQAPEKTVFINDIAIEDWPLSQLRSQFSVVSQSINLRATTLEENIAYGCCENDNLIEKNSRINHSIETAQLSGFVSTKGHYKNITIGEEGSLLSGGQKQRVAIARAVYRDSQFLILDEATSALDNDSEEKFMQSLNKIKQGKTVLMVAHRPAAIRQADRIVVMDKGQIIEVGSHQQLIEKKGLYCDLFNNPMKLAV